MHVKQVYHVSRYTYIHIFIYYPTLRYAPVDLINRFYAPQAKRRVGYYAMARVVRQYTVVELSHTNIQFFS